LLRCAPNLVSVGSWQIYLKLFRADPETWAMIPLIPFLVAVVLFFAGLLRLTRTGRQALEGLTANRRNLIWAVIAMLILILTLVPPNFPGDEQYAAGQEDAVYLLAGSLGLLLLLAGLGRKADFLARPVLSGYRRLMSMNPGLVVAAAALFVFLAANAVSWLVFGHTAHVHDTFAQLFQAKLFAHGKLYAPSPPLPQFFDMMHTINNGRWYSQYPPGHPLILTLGVLINAPWIINPLLGALTVVAIYYLGKEVYDDATARLATILAGLSPFLVFMSSEFMNHCSALFFTTLFMLFFAKTLKAKGIGYAILAGLAMGMVINIRPFTALLISIPFVLVVLYRLCQNPRGSLGRFSLMLGGGLLMLGLFLGYNRLTNGSPFLLGYTVKYGPGHDLGLGRGAWGETLTFQSALLETSMDLNALNRFLFEFPIPSLVFVAILLASRARGHPSEVCPLSWDYLLMAIPVMLVGGYFFYWWHTRLLFGPRWEFEALGALTLLSARGLRRLPGFIQQNLQLAIPTERIRVGIGKLLLLCYLSMAAVAVPALVKLYAPGLGFSGRTAETVRGAGLRRALVFVPCYDEVALENNLALDGDVVFARDLGPLNPILQRFYPGRRFYFANRDSLRELPDIGFERSRVKEGLEDVARQLDTMPFEGHRCLLFPVAELVDMVARPADRHGLRIVTYRQLSQVLTDQPSRVKEFLPAIAVWIAGDNSQALNLFAAMDRQDNFRIGDLRFTHLAASPNGLVLVYDIRRAEDDLGELVHPAAIAVRRLSRGAGG
jgi:hypothetical protein